MKVGALGLDRDHLALREMHYLRERYPAWILQQHFVAGLDDRTDRLEDGLLAGQRDAALFGEIIRAEVAVGIIADGSSQRGHAARRRVSGDILIESFFGSLLDMFRSRKIRLASAEIDDFDAL